MDTSLTQFNNGKPLTPQQIQDIRAQSGVSSVSKPSTGAINPRANRSAPVETAAPPSVMDVVQNTLGGVKKVAGNVIQSTKDIQKNSLDSLQKDMEGSAGDINHAQTNESAVGRLADTGKSLVKSGISGTWDLAQFVLAPLSGLVGGAVTSKENSDALANTSGVQSVADSKVGDAVQTVQAKMDELKQAHPDWYKGVSDAIQLALLAAGGEKAPEALSKLSEGVSSDVNAVKGVIDKTGEMVNGVKDKLLKTGETQPVDTFNQNVKDASDSIYPKFSNREKANITLKDEKGIMGTKSVPDVVSDPRTKPLVESVANLPDDIKLKPSDTVAIKDSKLSQGISRLHQETASHLAEPNIKAATTYKPADYQNFMKEKVLDPIEKELGADSIEYKEAQKAINTSESLIKEPNASGVHEGRQSFDTEFEKANPRAFKKAKDSFGSQLDPQTTATIEGGRETRNAMNDFTENLLQENDPYRSHLREESNLIRAKDEMRARSTDQLNKNSVTRFLDRNPKTKKAVETTGHILKVGAGVDAVKSL